MWKLAGSPSPITIDPAKDFPGRFVRLNLKFDSFDKWGKKIKGRSLTIALISTYFPCNDQNHDRFCTILDSMLNSINVNTTIIIGGDINARIGTRTCEEHMQILGQHGIPRSNARGESLLHVSAGHKLRIENTFFKHGEEDYATYTSIPTVHYPHGVPSMHDVFACSQSFHKSMSIMAL
jgi:hypothetical protein